MAAPLSFSVSAPASSANLGPGFDVLAMALELRNTVEVRGGSGVVTIRGHGADTLPADGTNLVARAFERASGTSIGDAGIDLRCDNAIPTARGLGSSTAAAACGALAGWHWAGVDHGDGTAQELFELLASFDGHPDNAAACAFGGLVLCHAIDGDAPDEHDIDVVELGPLGWITPIVVVPDRELSTDSARAALPSTYTTHDVVRTIGSAGLLVGALLGGHPELLEDVLDADVIHEPYRADLVPELAEVRAALAAVPALGATLSGAGPSVLVWCEPDGVDQTVGSLAIDFPDATILSLACASEGAVVLP